MPDGLEGKLTSITKPFDIITGKFAEWAGLSGADKVIYQSSATAQWYGALQSLVADLTCKKFLSTIIKIFLGGVYYTLFITQEGLNPRLRKELQVMGDRLITVVAEDLGEDFVSPKLAKNLASVTKSLRRKEKPELGDLFHVAGDFSKSLDEWAGFFNSFKALLGLGSKPSESSPTEESIESYETSGGGSEEETGSYSEGASWS